MHTNGFMKFNLSYLLLIFFTLLAPLSVADELFEAVYKGRYSGLKVVLTRSLERVSDTQYQLQSNAKSLIASIKEKSQFEIDNKLIVANRYDYVRSVLGKKSKQYLEFNRKDNIVHYRRADKSSKNADFEITKPETLDPSLYQLKLQQELYAGKTKLLFTFAKDSRIKNLEFQVSGSEHYKLGDKTYQAILVERINQPDESQTQIKVIPELNYQIAEIIQIDDDGSDYKISLTNYKGKQDLIHAFYNSLMPVATKTQ